MENSVTLLEKLAKTFNVSASSLYRKNDRKWVVTLDGLYECMETNHTIRYSDGTTKKVLAGGDLSAMCDSFEEAVEFLANRTIRKPVVFLSNCGFGHFAGNVDDETPIITRYEFGQARESMEYNEKILRAAMHAHGLATLPYKMA